MIKFALDLSDRGGEVRQAIAQLWERSEICVLICEESIREVPWFPRRPTWRSAFTTHSSNAAALMAQFCASHHYPEIRHEALRMLDREDPSGSFRMVDREALFHSYCLQILDKQIEFGIEAYVADVTPHEFISYLWWQLSVWNGLKVLFFQPCGIGPFVLPRQGFDALVCVPDSRNSSISSGDAGQSVARFFARLEGRDSAQWITRQKITDHESQKFSRVFSKLRALLSRGPHALAESDFDFSMVSERFQSSLWLVRNLIVLKSKNTLKESLLSFANLPESLDFPFVLFTLHYEPERTSRPEGLEYADQMRALLEIRKLVPQNVSIVVKEHYSQISGTLRGHLGRSRHLYKLVCSIPNTVLAHAQADNIALVKSALCVFTLTGTIGIEAPYLGTRVVFFGAPWWAGIPGTVDFRELSTWSDLSNVVRPAKAEHILAIEERITSHMIYGLAGEPAFKLSDRWGSLPEALVEKHVSSLEDLLARL